MLLQNYKKMRKNIKQKHFEYLFQQSIPVMLSLCTYHVVSLPAILLHSPISNK
jgi:hypothetical protein